jgi:Raf kinase inhibitor-like YbhB/YbcL family protein
MKITSMAFEQGQPIPSKYTCDGENINPPLEILDVPEGTKSLALISDDPDAPAGTWTHWLVWNINPETGIISENSVPAEAVEGTTSFGKPGYGGPCPPSGEHQYFFRLYALDTVLDLDPGADSAQLEAAMQGHILEQTEVMGVYSR